MDAQFQVLPVFFPTDLEDLAALAEMKVLQGHFFHQLAELELGELVADAFVIWLSTIAALFFGLLKSHRPQLQDMALAALVVVILVVPAMQASTAANRAEDRFQHFFQAGLDLGYFVVHGFKPRIA